MHQSKPPAATKSSASYEIDNLIKLSSWSIVVGWSWTTGVIGRLFNKCSQPTCKLSTLGACVGECGMAQSVRTNREREYARSQSTTPTQQQ